MSLDATRWAWVAPVENCSQRVILLSLADRAGEDHKAWPSIRRLTIDTVCNRKTIMKHLDRLEEIQLLRDTGETRGNGVKVYQLIGVHGREDAATDTKKGTSTKIGTSTKNGTATSTKIGTATSTKIGTQNLPIESTNESTNIYKAKFSFSNALLELGADQQLVSDFLQVRKNKKAADTETAFKSFITQQQKSGLSLNAVLEMCVVRDWKGFQAAWIQNQATAKKPHQYGQGFEQPTKRFGNYQEEQQFKDVN